jgi:hypothetical protein
MNWTTIQDAFYAWATKYSDLPVIWRHQNAPQPTRAFIVLHIDNVVPVGYDTETLPNGRGERTIYGTREFDLSIAFFGTSGQGVPDDVVTSVDPTASLAALTSTLNRADVREILRASDIIILDFEQSVDTSYVEGEHQVERADSVISCRTSYYTTYGGDTEETKTIEQTNMAGTFDGTLKNITA